MSVITFGGGDPFLYEFLPSLILRAKERGMTVHVDTNSLAMKQTYETLELLENSVDLLGLPLDGADAEMHGSMRDSAVHFDILMARLDWLKSLRPKTKLNTIVTGANLTSIERIADLVVDEIRPARWSVYQYWPLAEGVNASGAHAISDGEFLAATSNLTARVNGQTTIEVNPLLSRRLTYPFVANDGELYVHSAGPLSSYDTLGSIFDENAVGEIFRRCGAERPAAITRYSDSDQPPLNF